MGEFRRDQDEQFERQRCNHHSCDIRKTNITFMIRGYNGGQLDNFDNLPVLFKNPLYCFLTKGTTTRSSLQHAVTVAVHHFAHVNLRKLNKAECKMPHLGRGNPWYQYGLGMNGVQPSGDGLGDSGG